MDVNREDSNATITSDYQPDYCGDFMDQPPPDYMAQLSTSNRHLSDIRLGTASSTPAVYRNDLLTKYLHAQTSNMVDPNARFQADLQKYGQHLNHGGNYVHGLEFQHVSAWTSSPVASNRVMTSPSHVLSGMTSNTSIPPLGYSISETMLRPLHSSHSEEVTHQLKYQMTELSSQLKSVLELSDSRGKFQDIPERDCGPHEQKNGKSYQTEQQLIRELSSTQQDLAKTANKLSDLKVAKRTEEKHLREQLQLQRQKTEEWRNRSESTQKTFHEARKELEAVKHYLTCIPSLEEANEMKKRLLHSEETRSKLQRLVLELEDKLKTTNEELDLYRKQQKNSAPEEPKPVLNDPSTDKLVADLAAAKKLLASRQQLLDEQIALHRREMKSLEERLAAEADAQMALHRQSCTKDEELKKFKTVVKQLTKQHQDLMEEKLQLQDQVCERQREAERIKHAVGRNVVSLLKEVESLVTVGTQLSDGSIPDISLLLGSIDMVTPGRSEWEEEDAVSNIQVDKLRDEVEILRSKVADKCAECLGRKINCQVQ